MLHPNSSGYAGMMEEQPARAFQHRRLQAPFQCRLLCRAFNMQHQHFGFGNQQRE